MSIEYIDADKAPSRANQYQVQQLGTVVFEYDGRTERVTSDGEQELTNGLIKVVQGKQTRSTSSRATARRTPTARDRDGYSTIAASLGADNYAVEKLVLAQQKDVPGRRVGADRRRPEDRLLRAGGRRC